jgi:hypothetical protein
LGGWKLSELLPLIEAYGALRAEGKEGPALEALADIKEALSDAGWEQFDAFCAASPMSAALGIDDAGGFWKHIAMLVWSASREKLVMGPEYKAQAPKFLANGAIQTRP